MDRPVKKNAKASRSRKTPPAPPTVDEHGGTLPLRVPDEAGDTPAKDKPDRLAGISTCLVSVANDHNS